MTFDAVQQLLLENLAAEFQAEAKSASSPKKQNNSAPCIKSVFDLSTWILRWIPEAKGPKAYGDGAQIWELPDCFFRAGDGATMFIIQFANGAISAGCQHETCPGSRTTGNHWLELREHFEGHRQTIDPNLDLELCTLPRTEYGLAERFRRRFGDKVRFVEGWGGKWLVYNGRSWEQSDCAAEIYAQDTINAIRREAWHLKEDDHAAENEKGKEAQPGTFEMGDGVPAGEPNAEPAETGQQPPAA